MTTTENVEERPIVRLVVYGPRVDQIVYDRLLTDAPSIEMLRELRRWIDHALAGEIHE